MNNFFDNDQNKNPSDQNDFSSSHDNTTPPVEPNQDQQYYYNYQYSQPSNNNHGNVDNNFNQYNNPSYNNPEKLKHNKKRPLMIVLIIVSIAIIILVIIPMIFAIVNPLSNNNDMITSDYLEITQTPSDNASPNQNGKLSTVDISSKVKPSVVGIVVYMQGISFEPAGQGSGVIMSNDGYIISNAHVFLDSKGSIVDGVKVVLDNNEEYEATIVGLDTKTDLAIIKINANNLTPAEFGDSNQLKVGEQVVAIGNPSGLQLAGSVTSGIVSALDRNIQKGYATSFIQTDAAINPGNSGGALVNAYGQVIGINSSKISATDYEGIGFAIPISQAKPIIDNLIQHGYVKDRVKLGISFKEIDEILAKINDVPQGLRVVEIDKNSDIYAKGVRTGDIITSADGNQIKSADDLTDILKTKKPNQTINLNIFRLSTVDKSTTFSVNVVLEEDKGDTVKTEQ